MFVRVVTKKKRYKINVMDLACQKVADQKLGGSNDIYRLEPGFAKVRLLHKIAYGGGGLVILVS